jgi:hypothetical protein
MKLLQLSGHEVHAHSGERCRGSRPISSCLQPREQVMCVHRLFPGAFGTSNKLWKCSLDFRHVRKSGLEAVGVGAIFGIRARDFEESASAALAACSKLEQGLC